MRNDETLKMMMDSREKELPTKQEGGIGPIGDDPTSSRVWPGLKNPRIVRVSRAFGGKDRHSKVTTIRGLRDRRVRLSVPTAIQLYDLQDRLGLNQPSKVVDWLLNATQHEIDKLPPLPIPSGNFIPFSQSFAINHEAIQPQSSSRPSSFKNPGYTGEDRPRPFASLSNRGNDENMSDAVIIEDLAKFSRGTYWNSGASRRTEQNEPSREPRIEKCMNIMKGNEVEDEYVSIRQASAHDPRHPSIFGNPCNSYYHSWESSNAYTSNLGVEAPSTLISSSLSLAPGPQLVLYPSGAMPPSMLSSYITASTDFDTRQLVSSASQNLPSNNNIRTCLNSGRPTMKSFHSNLDSAHHHSEQDCNES